MAIIIPFLVLIFPPALSYSTAGSKCLAMTKETFTLTGHNIIPDLGEFANHSYSPDVLDVLDTRMKVITSLMKFLPSFVFFYLRMEHHDRLSLEHDLESYYRSKNPFAGIFNGTTFADKALTHISNLGMGEPDISISNNSEAFEPWSHLGKDFTAKASTNTLERLLFHSNASISQSLKEIKSAKDRTVFSLLPKLGLVSPLETAGSESICRNESSRDEDELLKLLYEAYIGPFHCQNESSIEECVEEVVQIVEQCSIQVETKMSKLNLSGILPLGIVTTTSSLGEDYLARGKYWCLISEYAERTKRQVIMLDEDDFFRSYVEGSLQWDTPDNGTSIENIFTTPAFISGAVVVAAVILFVMFLLHSRRNHKRLLTKNDVDEFFNGKRNESGWLGLSYNQDLEILKDDICLDVENILGSGAFGCVYGGYISVKGLRQEVAIKTMKKISECVATLKGLCSEIKVLSHLGTHEHIVCLVGAYTAELEKGIVYVIMEMCSRGSLERYLQLMKNPESDQYLILVEKDSTREMISRGESLESERRGNEEEHLLIRFSREICSGMEYLAGKKVIHGDLATRNILLTSNLQAKISDFGLSRRLYEYTKYVKKQEEPIPWKWMAPEALTKLEFSEQSDVWSYGVTIWEIFSFGNTPYPGLGWRPDFPNELEKGLRLEMPEDCPQHFYEIMQMCWCINPSERPTFSQLNG